MDDELLVKVGEALLLTDEPALRNDLSDTFRFAGWGGAGGALIHIRLRSWLERQAGDKALLQRLEAADAEPWPVIRAALAASGD
jgi:hypothetical protein